MSTEMTETIIKAIKEVGVPVVMLAVVVYLFREAACTVHATVLVPVVESHTKFLDRTERTLEEISTTQNQQATTLQELAVGQRDIQAKLTGGRP
jgi:hypothetical protein